MCADLCHLLFPRHIKGKSIMDNSSKNLATKNTQYFTVDENGQPFMSQTALSMKLGVDRTAISKYVKKSRHTLKLNNNNQLHAESLELVTWYYAFESQRPSKKALEFYRELAKIGAQDYIYQKAGYIMEVKSPDIIMKAEKGDFKAMLEESKLEARLEFFRKKVEYQNLLLDKRTAVEIKRAEFEAKKIADEQKLHDLIMEQDLRAIENREITLIKGVKVGVPNDADMVASKIILPHNSVTANLALHSSKITPMDFNLVAHSLGYIEKKQAP